VLFRLQDQLAALNDNATPEGQAVFDALSKTLDCFWIKGGCSINVLGQAWLSIDVYSEG
jgi:hypothetical protein